MEFRADARYISLRHYSVRLVGKSQLTLHFPSNFGISQLDFSTKVDYSNIFHFISFHFLFQKKQKKNKRSKKRGK